ncbi:hypothetical protein [Paraherbaspirillum soli]|uniref:Uncharacterized protein n=1 Tax=Paraherbaspirillum soli TaxID=631222 RepID=A0ABW0MBZ7_9BURK
MHQPTKATIEQLIKRLRRYPAQYVLDGRRKTTLLCAAADMIEQLSAMPAASKKKLGITQADPLRPYATDEYDANFGNCLFLHFDNAEAPPDVYCGSPLEVYPPFDAKYWTHFVRFDFNAVINAALQSAAPEPQAQ